ncbi:MAG TPA: hypothetical protein VF662_09600 [Allosphingosinicella sp.]|jgi:hypothetical protein
MDSSELERRIERLSSTVSAAVSSGRGDWKAIWSDIKLIGRGFKGSDFPDRERREVAWTTFQNAVQVVKDQREESQARRAQMAEGSGRHLRHILQLVEAAGPGSDWADLAMTLSTGGMSLLVRAGMDAVFGPTDEARLSLDRRNRCLKDAGTYLKEHKEEMTGADKAEAFAAITAQRANVQGDWAAYKEAQSRAYKARQERRQEKVEKQERWRQGQHEFVDKLTEALNRKSGQLERALSHLQDLYAKRSDAWSDSYRERVDEWIYEARGRIDSLGAAVSDIKDKIAEVNNRL